MQSTAISTSADDSFVPLLGQGHSHEPHNELASVVLSSSGIGVREIEYPTLRTGRTVKLLLSTSGVSGALTTFHSSSLIAWCNWNDQPVSEA